MTFFLFVKEKLLVVKRVGDHRLLDRHTSQSKQAIVVYKVNKRKQKAKTNKPKVNKFAPG